MVSQTPANGENRRTGMSLQVVILASLGVTWLRCEIGMRDMVENKIGDFFAEYAGAEIVCTGQIDVANMRIGLGQDLRNATRVRMGVFPADQRSRDIARA